MRGNDKKPRTLMRISVTEQHAAKLQSLLRYDAETGKFYWLVDRYGRNGARSGDVAGWKHDNGYWYIRTAGSKYIAHRLAWLFHFGKWPEKMIDHINGDKLDNRIVNLRLATPSQNIANTNRTCAISKMRGAHFDRSRKKWASRIMVNGHVTHLGRFNTPEEASAAYKAARAKAFGEFSA